MLTLWYRKTAQEPSQDCEGNCERQGYDEGQEEVRDGGSVGGGVVDDLKGGGIKVEDQAVYLSDGGRSCVLWLVRIRIENADSACLQAWGLSGLIWGEPDRPQART